MFPARGVLSANKPNPLVLWLVIACLLTASTSGLRFCDWAVGTFTMSTVLSGMTQTLWLETVISLEKIIILETFCL